MGEWTAKPKPPLGPPKRSARCCCADVEGAAHPDCWGEWLVPADEHPQTFCGDPICPPCWDDLRRTLALLKSKGVTMGVRFGG